MDNTRSENVLARLTIICSVVTVCVSLFVIAGWLLNWLIIARINPVYIPMAPSTAILFSALSAALLVYSCPSVNLAVKKFTGYGVALIFVICLIIFIEFLAGSRFDIEWILLSDPGKFGNVPIGRMSPITAVGFMLSGLALFLLFFYSKEKQSGKGIAAYLAAIVFFAGFVILLGYLYGVPLFYGGTIIPVALTTGIAFVFFSFGILSAAGPDCLPARLFIGNSVQARLMRAFLPVTIAIIVIGGWLYIVITLHTTATLLEISTVMVILSIVIIGGLIFKISQILGNDMDRANIQLKQADERLNRINTCLLNMSYDYDRNIQAFTALCGELLHADCALYNRLDDNILCVKGKWNTPQDMPSEDTPKGHICFDVIKHKSDSPLIIPYLQKSEYVKTDPNVLKYGLQTYVGYPVRFGGITRGALCVVYTSVYKTTNNDLMSLGIIAAAIGQEEERKRAEETLRGSEESYRTLIENINLGVCLIDKEHKLIAVNSAFCKMFGIVKEELKGKHCFEICSKSGLVCPDCPGAKCMALKKMVKMEKEYILANGIYLPVIIHAYPVLDSDNNVKAFVKIIEDVSEYKKIEQAKKNMIRDISHSLKTPIAMTEMAFDIAKNSINTGDEASLIKANRIASENLKRLRKDINNILQEFSIDVHKDVIAKDKNASLNAAIVKITNALKSFMEEKGLQLDVNFLLNVDNVKIDVRDLETILNNLLENAVKFTDKGKISITGKCKGKMIEIEVKDTGCGLSEEDIKMVFEKFYKRNAAIEGTGLGLSICKELVEMYGGEINIYSEGVGKGSTVVVSLPQA